MLLRPSILLAAFAGLVAADFAAVSGALDNVNALLLQINSQILNLGANNIASAGPQLLQLGQTIQPSLDSIVKQIASTTPLNAQETANLNAARVALGKPTRRFRSFQGERGTRYCEIVPVECDVFALVDTMKAQPHAELRTLHFRVCFGRARNKSAPVLQILILSSTRTQHQGIR